MPKEPTVGPEQYQGEDEMGDDINRRVDAPPAPPRFQEPLAVSSENTAKKPDEEPLGEIIDITERLKQGRS